MLKIVFIRHSITYGNQQKRYIGTTDEPLCQEGITLIKNRTYPPVEAIFTSPMKRCIQTVSLIYPGKPYTAIENLRECDFGEFENKNYKELEGNPHYQEWIDSNATLPFPRGESREGFAARSRQALLDILANPGLQGLECIAIIAHGGTVMSILETYGRPKKDYYAWHPANGGGYIVETPVGNWGDPGKLHELQVIEKVY